MVISSWMQCVFLKVKTSIIYPASLPKLRLLVCLWAGRNEPNSLQCAKELTRVILSALTETEAEEIEAAFKKAIEKTQAPIDSQIALGPGSFGWNPAHPIGTCTKCGAEMIYNVPRLGPDGGFVHVATGSPLCDPE